MHTAFPGLDEIRAIANNTEMAEDDRKSAIKAILSRWSTPSLAMLHNALSR